MRNTVLLVLMVISWNSFAAQVCRDDIPVTAADSRFEVDGNEVFDHATNLIWQRCPLGRSGADCSGGSDQTYNWQQALSAATQERASTGLPWRLPNVKELEATVEESCVVPSVNLSAFPNMAKRETYWSGSPYKAEANTAWFVEFGDGFSGIGPQLDPHKVRLVRSPPPVLDAPLLPD